MPLHNHALQWTPHRIRGARFFQALIEQSRDAVVVADESGVITYQSPAVTPELGYRPDECVGHSILEYVHPWDRGLVQRSLEGALGSPGGSVTMELRLQVASGEWEWVEVRASNLLDVPEVRGLVLHTLVIHPRKELELRNLAARVDPHFLYNVLHSVAAMVREGKGRESVEALGRLRELMGSRLLGTEDRAVTLGEEWRWVHDYLALERLRFGDEVRIQMDPLPPELQSVPVPYRIIQPMVENAVKHGLRTRLDGGTISASAHRAPEGAAVIRVVERGGPRVRSVESDGLGVGLETVRQRLQLQYGDSARLDLEVRPDSSTAELRIPLRTDIGGGPH